MRPGAPSAKVVLYAVGRAGIGHAIRARRLAEHLVRGATGRVEAVVVTGHVDAGRLLGEGPQVTVRVPEETVRLLEQAARASITWDAVRGARKALAEVLEEIKPDVVVSTSPNGLAGEFGEAMARLHTGCRTVLALRDIYHPPRHPETYAGLGERFDEIVIGAPRELSRWTPPKVLDSGVPPANYLGYLSPLELVAATGNVVRAPVLRCQIGGGRDGAEMVESVIAAFAAVRPADKQLDVSVGPLFPCQALERLRRHAVDGLHISTWSPIDQGVAQPEAVISMAGYNSSVEAACTGVPTLLWPRHDNSDREQEIRAAQFARRFANIDVHEGGFRSLSKWIADQFRTGRSGTKSSALPGFFALPGLVSSRVLGCTGNAQDYARPPGHGFTEE